MFSGKFIKKNGELIFNGLQDELSYEIFVDKIKEGQVVEMYIDIVGQDHSKLQLAKVHACIRELSKESGYNFDDMKQLIKEKSGLQDKSFANCTKDELMLAIQSCIDIGKDNFNLNLG
jgi:hypothetical protein